MDKAFCVPRPIFSTAKETAHTVKMEKPPAKYGNHLLFDVSTEIFSISAAYFSPMIRVRESEKSSERERENEREVGEVMHRR